MPTQGAWIVGIDGCPAGWMVVLAPLAGADAPRLVVLPALSGLTTLGVEIAAIAVDMPIGLPDRIEGSGRAAERAVRPLLGPRQSSVFTIPARAAIEATDYASACAAALVGSDPPRKVAKQAFNLFPKIRELDHWLRAGSRPSCPVVETHPELVFRRLNGQPLIHPKKTPEGKSERRTLLLSAGLPADWLAEKPPRGAGQDDLADAWACLLTARRVASGEAVTYPDPPPLDSFGLPMAIHC